MVGLKPAYGGSIPSFLVSSLDLHECRLFKCVVGRGAPVESFHVSGCEFYCKNFSFSSECFPEDKEEYNNGD